jgi:glycosyltransferase involved in cell wall biosynthesis
MNGRPGLTVVILTYNSGATIGTCLESLVQQEYPDFEVVVVDDDSTDSTLSVVSRYSPRLRLSVRRNGAHNIPRGRNIGLACSRTDLVAFVDSDDTAAPDWTRVIVETFREQPEIALISGNRVPAHRTSTAHAIALNDDAIRRLFGGDIMAFSAGNCAVNRKVMQDAHFDEYFRFGEDLELVSRIRGHYRCSHVPRMKINYYSRDTFWDYAKQMYKYGFMKQYVSFVSRSYRWLDFVPLALLVGGGLTSVVIRSWWFLLLTLPFSLLEALFVIFYQRCPGRAAALTFPAWIIKNLSWSCGIGHGLVTLAFDGDTRRLLRAKRAGRI